MRTLILLLFTAATVVSCSCDPEQLADTSWTLDSFSTQEGPQELLPGFMPGEEKPIALAFDTEGKFTLKEGCNTVAGAYSAQSSCGIAFEVKMTTKRACPDNIAAQAATIQDLLSAGSSFSLKGDGSLIIKTPNAGKLVFSAR